MMKKSILDLIGYRPGIIKDTFALGALIILAMIALMIIYGVIFYLFGPLPDFLR